MIRSFFVFGIQKRCKYVTFSPYFLY